MAEATRIHAVLCAIADGLAAEEALEGIQIATAYLGADNTLRESIQMAGDDDIDQEWAALGRRSRDEVLTLRGFVIVQKPGKGETVIRAARERAVELASAVEAFLRADPSIGGEAKTAQFRSAGLHQTATTEGRVCVLEFEIETKARLVTS